MKHPTSGVSHFVIKKNINNKVLIYKEVTKTQKMREKIKKIKAKYQRLKIEKILSHAQLIQNTDFVIYQELKELRKIINKRWILRVKVLKKKN